MSDSASIQAIQQLVYTAQGVLQSRDPITFTDSSGAATQIFNIASEAASPPPTRSRPWRWSA